MGGLHRLGLGLLLVFPLAYPLAPTLLIVPETLAT
jgi:hypothetical protein